MSTPVARFGHGSRVPGWDEAANLAKDPAEIPDPATTDVPAELRAELEAHMANYPDRRSAALPALAAAQRLHGWCSPRAIEQTACVMRLTPGYLAAVATFYDMLETSPVGRHSIYVCTNISCSLRGADELFEAVRVAAGEDPAFNVRSFECLGACDIAPMVSVDGVYVGPLTPQDAPVLLEDVRAGRPVLAEKQLARRLVADPRANSREFPEHPAEHRARAGAGNPDIDPSRALVGAPMEGDRPGPGAPHEETQQQPPQAEPASDDSAERHP
jgi:NADH-quinone oxidoreductase subunit E